MTDSGLSQRAFARHLGVSHIAVQRAIVTGRLARSVAKDAAGRWRIVDVALGEQEWTANGDMSRAPAAIKQRESDRRSGGTVDVPVGATVDVDVLGTVPGGTLSLADATAQEKAWKARLAELQYREKSGALVDGRQVELKMVEVFTRCRTKLLGVPAKLKTSCPELTRAQLMAIDAAIRQACDELAVADVSEGAA